jgi:hypothetical protein
LLIAGLCSAWNCALNALLTSFRDIAEFSCRSRIQLLLSPAAALDLQSSPANLMLLDVTKRDAYREAEGDDLGSPLTPTLHNSPAWLPEFQISGEAVMESLTWILGLIAVLLGAISIGNRFVQQVPPVEKDPARRTTQLKRRRLSPSRWMP